MPGKNYITPSGLQRLNDEHRFLLARERPAVTEVVAWAASNGDRSENADYQYGKRRYPLADFWVVIFANINRYRPAAVVRTTPTCRLGETIPP
jgi:hypothetical protein